MSRPPAVAALLALMLGAAIWAGQTLPLVGSASKRQESGSAVVSGRVVRAQDGLPLAGAIVRCQRPGRIRGCMTGWTVEVESTFERVLTDPDGRFRLVFPGGLGHNWTVVMPTADTGLGQLYIQGEDGELRNSLDPGETVEVRVEVPMATRLSGRVVDEAGGGMSGARVLVWHASRPFDSDRRRIEPDLCVLTDDRGEFVIAATSSIAELEAEADDSTANDRVSVRADPGASFTDLTLTLHRARFVEGFVTDASGRPLTDCHLSAARGTSGHDGEPMGSKELLRHTKLFLSCRIGPAGHFRLGPLPHDEVEVVASLGQDLRWAGKLIPDDGALHIVLDAGCVEATELERPGQH